MVMTIEELKNILPNPIDTVKRLDKYVIGQEHTKKTLALSLLHWSILRLKEKGHIDCDLLIEKTNVLMLGTTGIGKTALIKALAEIANVPLTIFDITSISGAGYVGGKVEDIISKYADECFDFVNDHAHLLKEARQDIFTRHDLYRDVTETGIIYIDEIDKIRRYRTHGPDVSGDMVQNELLKLLDGGDVNLGNSKLKWPRSGIQEVRTDKILFICGGAFSGLSEIIMERISKNSGIGFSADLQKNKESLSNYDDIFDYVTHQDLVNYGFKPELLGRLPLLTSLKSLSVETMERIIVEPKNSIFKQYEALFQVFGIKLTIEKDALKDMATKAVSLKIGARSLKNLFSKLLVDEFYKIFNYEDITFTINKKFVAEKLKDYEV